MQKMNSSVKSLQPQNECQQMFSQTINFSNGNSLNASQNNHKRTQSLNGRESLSGNKSSKKQSGFKIFKKTSQSSTIQNDEGDNSFLDNSFCGSQKNHDMLQNSFKNNQHTSVLELETLANNLPSTIPQNRSSNMMNVDINSFNEHLRSPNTSNMEGVFKQIDLSHYQSQSSIYQSRAHTLNDINIKESAEFGGNLKNKIAEINGKFNKNGTFNNTLHQNNLHNGYQQNYISNYSDKENYPTLNQLREDKNPTISKILERMNGRFEDIESKMERILLQNLSGQNQSTNQHKNYQDNSNDSRNQQYVDQELLQQLILRIDVLEQKMEGFDTGFVNYKRQIEGSLQQFQQIIQKSLIQIMERSEQIEKKMGIVSVKFSNDQMIKQNYESIIDRLNKINSDFNERFQNAESQTHRKEEQITMQVFTHSERLNTLERDISKLVNTVNTAADPTDKNSNYKWLSEELNYVKNRQVQFLSMLMEISTLVGLK